MLSGEAMQRGRYAGFGEASFDDPSGFPGEPEESPRYTFPLHDPYEDEIEDPTRNEHRRAMKDTDHYRLWPDEDSQISAPHISRPSGSFHHHDPISSYDPYTPMPLRGPAMLDMDVVSHTDDLASHWHTSDYDTRSARGNDYDFMRMHSTVETAGQNAHGSASPANQDSPSSTGSNETATTEVHTHTLHDANITSPLEAQHFHTAPPTGHNVDGTNLKRKPATLAGASSDPKPTSTKKRERDVDYIPDATADKDDFLISSGPPSKRHSMPPKAPRNTNNSTKNPYNMVLMSSEDTVAQDAKTRPSPGGVDATHADAHPYVSPSGNVPSFQMGASATRVRTNQPTQMQKQPTTPSAASTGPAIAFKVPSSLPTSLLRSVTSPSNSAGSNDAPKNEASSPVAHAAPTHASSPSNTPTGNGYTLIGTSPPDVTHATGQPTMPNYPPRTAAPAAPAQAYPSQSPAALHNSSMPLTSYGQPGFGANRSAPNSHMPNAPSNARVAAPPSRNSVDHLDERALTPSNGQHSAMDLEKLIYTVSQLTGQCTSVLHAFVVHPSSIDEQYANLNNLLSLRRHIGEMFRVVNESVQDVQSRNVPSGYTNNMAMNQQPPQQPQPPQSYMTRPALPLPPGQSPSQASQAHGPPSVASHHMHYASNNHHQNVPSPSMQNSQQPQYTSGQTSYYHPGYQHGSVGSAPNSQTLSNMQHGPSNNAAQMQGPYFQPHPRPHPSHLTNQHSANPSTQGQAPISSVPVVQHNSPYQMRPMNLNMSHQ